MTNSVQICVFEAQKFVHLRPILADFPDTNHQELPGAYEGAFQYGRMGDKTMNNYTTSPQLLCLRPTLPASSQLPCLFGSN